MVRSIVLTKSLSVGQITFILRAIIQIIAFLGILLLSRIILSASPRLASFGTHDVLNRIVGKETSTRSSVKWMFSYFRGRNADPTTPTRLLFAISLFTFFSLFVSLSDVGFLGFDTCLVPDAPIFDTPLSVSDDTMALSTVRAALVNGTDPHHVRAFRCDSSEVVRFRPKVELHQCTSWRNSTYADKDLFKGINSTDSDMLMPRLLKNVTNEANFYLNSYYIGPGAARVSKTTLGNGIVAEPHSTGARAVFGLPSLGKERKAFLNKTLATETQMGCVNLGMTSFKNLDGSINSTHQLDLQWVTNRKYFGPERFQSTLMKHAEKVREYYRPLYTETVGDELAIYRGPSRVSETAEISNVPFSVVGSNNDTTWTGIYMLGNCTSDLMTELDIPKDPTVDPVKMCQVYSLSGSFALRGEVYSGQQTFLCAAATQINMVSATVELTQDNRVVLDMQRLPSDLHVTQADYWDVTQTTNSSIFGEAEVFMTFPPSVRYTLSDNPSGPTEHYILPLPNDKYRGKGPGSGGLALSKTGTAIVSPEDYTLDLRGLLILDEGREPFQFSPEKLTTWGGQVAAAQILTSTAFNGWTARDSAPIFIASTGGISAVCYRVPYAAGFIPLLVAGLVSLLWGILILFSSAFKASKKMEELYGGITPLRSTVCPQSAESEALFEWQIFPEPHLQLLGQGEPIVDEGKAGGRAVDSLKTVPAMK